MNDGKNDNVDDRAAEGAPPPPAAPAAPIAAAVAAVPVPHAVAIDNLPAPAAAAEAGPLPLPIPQPEVPRRHDLRHNRPAVLQDQQELVVLRRRIRRRLRLLRRAAHNHHGFRSAARVLMVGEGDAFEQLVNHGLVVESDDDDDVDDSLHFGRFVTALGALRERHEGDTRRRTVQQISLVDINWDTLPEDDMERLFGHVLPHHPTICTVIISVKHLPARYFQLLTESIPAFAAGAAAGSHSISNLTITDGADNLWHQDQLSQALANMLRRNAIIHTLNLREDITSEHCERICHALPGNTNLGFLHVSVDTVFPRTLVGVDESSLRLLSIRGGSFSEGAVPSLARQLRTNTTLENLVLDDDTGAAENDDDNGSSSSSSSITRDDGSQALLELVKTYNYTIQIVGGNMGMLATNDPRVQAQFRHYTIRNAQIRTALEHMQSADLEEQRLVMSPDRLASALELVRDVPTALYKVVKMHVHVILERLLEGERRQSS